MHKYTTLASIDSPTYLLNRHIFYALITFGLINSFALKPCVTTLCTLQYTHACCVYVCRLVRTHIFTYRRVRTQQTSQPVVLHKNRVAEQSNQPANEIDEVDAQHHQRVKALAIDR